MARPVDRYQVGSGLPIYGGKSAPALGYKFDSVSSFNGSANSGVPSANDVNKALLFGLHGSGGPNTSTGKQYRASVSGSLALSASTNSTTGIGYEASNTFGFSVVQSYPSSVYPDHIIVRPIDYWGKWPNNTARESAHQGLLLSTDNKFHLISEHRYDALYDWAVANLPYDPKKYCLSGGSMGGWGTGSYGVRRYAKFAALYPDRPRWRFGYSTGSISVPVYDTGFVGYSVANSPMIAAEDGGGTLAAYNDMVAYVSNPTNKVRRIGWLMARNDGYAVWQDHLDMVTAMRANKRGFAFAWNNGGHDTGPSMDELLKSYPYGTFRTDRGYPLFTDHSLDKDPAVDLVGGINIGLSFRNVVETSTGWSCEVTSVVGACTVNVEPISDVFTKPVAKTQVIIPAANYWQFVQFQ